MSFLDPEPANNPAVDLLAEPQCNFSYSEDYLLTIFIDLQNQIAHSLTLLFLLTYTSSWTTFFDDCMSLIQKNSQRGQPFEPLPTQIFLKILSSIDEEVADVLYTSTKKPGDQQLNTDIKDRIRSYDVQKLTNMLLQVMVAFQADTENEELVRLSLVVIGQWIGERPVPLCR
jgi:exportin-T